ncbi:hexose-6-phosphate:phosphate antiporter [Corynebacterium pseudotuberculosis]|uniref:hexose-6-phosphate:phosphate antiporter n=1 Tax=Corynebacterium pseudotuberculosis TaxID=1719 RepID=UPI0007190DF6|nr:hexose-6-phosphate:phosphate antiporter [Corynebacterium pseudotuberculosis]ALP33333.1 Sugar phosphate antiporter [Corynebacterium pseudotuberculosis]ALR34572.1 Sugar phosphate antiporter [Corynebacterium pseudotuberculosis]APX36881.1 hexose phosphate transporter [Corynebacterium pseudotuberculosis]APX38428.1 hexose phosphate transporter [Corynebacterium pseudotuberculosis]AQL52110.1 Hexose phosphate transport protein UhpT [Corynebacterium pseudotuberculosis]
MTSFFDLKKIPNKGIPLEQQRKEWLGQFLKAFFVVFFVYMSMYFIRNNFKVAQPMLKEEFGLTTLQLGYIGLAFSITYGIGKTLVGYFVDGRNSKRVISMLLLCASVMVLMMGLLLSYFGSVIGIFIVLWGLNGLFQSAGGPASYSTISRWAPRTKRGKYLGLWNASHNVGGALAGGIALWGANMFFGGNVVGMFVFPALIGLAIGAIGLFVGKDDPEELGWNRSEEIFGEAVEEENTETEDLAKKDVFFTYVLKNPWLWTLCIANVFVYIVRIGIDNWAPLYVTEESHFSKGDAVNTIFYFEIGALVASLLWGYVSDLLKGRRAVVSIGCLFMVYFAVMLYRNASSVMMVNIALLILGALIFGPQLLIGVSLVGFVPKRAVSVANGMTGTFGYLFGDSMAKVGLAAIADPEREGLNVFGFLLHGWGAVFTVFYFALTIGILLLAIVAIGEERKIRKLQAAEEGGAEEDREKVVV